MGLPHYSSLTRVVLKANISNFTCRDATQCNQAANRGQMDIGARLMDIGASLMDIGARLMNIGARLMDRCKIDGHKFKVGQTIDFHIEFYSFSSYTLSCTRFTETRNF